MTCPDPGCPRTCQLERGDVRAGLLGKERLLVQAETSSDPGYGSEEEGAEVATAV